MQIQTPVKVIGIDPGPENSAVVEYDGERVVSAAYLDNKELLREMGIVRGTGLMARVAIEFPEARGGGVPVSQGILDTAGWAGTFNADRAAKFIKPRDVRIYFCGTAMATRAQVRQALIDQIGPVGKKQSPGPLYEIGRPHDYQHTDDDQPVTGHLWDALAVAVMAHDLFQGRTEG